VGCGHWEGKGVWTEEPMDRWMRAGRSWGWEEEEAESDARRGGGQSKTDGGVRGWVGRSGTRFSSAIRSGRVSEADAWAQRPTADLATCPGAVSTFLPTDCRCCFLRTSSSSGAARRDVRRRRDLRHGRGLLFSLC
jgi:hypothetical protein